MNGNIKILKMFRTKQYYYLLNNVDWQVAVKLRQLRVLKWAKNNGYDIEPKIFDYSIINKHLDVLKWACKNNFIDKCLYQ